MDINDKEIKQKIRKETEKRTNVQQKRIEKGLGVRKYSMLVKISSKIYNNSCQKCREEIFRFARKGGDFDPDRLCFKCQNENEPYIDSLKRLLPK